MKFRHYIFALFALAFTQCRPDVIIPFEPFGPKTDEIRALLQQATDSTRIYSFTLNRPTNASVTLTAAHGSFLLIPNLDATFVNQQGDAVDCSSCNELKLNIKEAMSSSQLVAHSLDLYPGIVAETTGAVHFSATCDGKQLQIKPGSKVILTAISNGSNSEFDHYEAITNADNQQTGWFAQPVGTVFHYSNSTTNDIGYEFNLIKTGWSAGFKPFNASAKQNVALQLETKYNAENTFAYLVLDDFKTCIQIPFNQTTGQFVLADVPTGMTARVLIVSLINDEWQSAIYPLNTNSPQVIIAPKKALESEILQFVRDLN